MKGALGTLIDTTVIAGRPAVYSLGDVMQGGAKGSPGWSWGRRVGWGARVELPSLAGLSVEEGLISGVSTFSFVIVTKPVVTRGGRFEEGPCSSRQTRSAPQPDARGYRNRGTVSS